jgi:ABC-type uncharacterized transport system substrate-binding protein
MFFILRRVILKVYKSLLAMVLVMFFASMTYAADYAGKKVLFIDSYHAGFLWSDGLTEGVKSVIDPSGAELKILRMDTKRNKSEEFKKEAGLKAKAVIEEFKPDVVIAADDNASKYLIQPYFKDNAVPFVFCGVNWDAANYGFPYSNVTGMVEVSGVKELVELLTQFSKGDRVGYLAEDTLTEHRNVDFYKSKLGITVAGSFAKDFADWKTKFTAMQSDVDILIIGNNASLGDFNADAALAHVKANSKIPSGAVGVAPMAYAMVGYLKVPQEQGQWAADKALAIISGTSPGSIPIEKNKEGKLVINTIIVEASGIEIPFSLIESADSVIE